jgi:hypothetical protein
VHRFLTPKLRPFRTFRVQLQTSALWRSAFLQALWEATAETVAQLMVNGPKGLWRGLKFPVSNGYVTIGEFVREGASLGAIIIGGVHLEVHFVSWVQREIQAVQQQVQSA